MKPFKTKHLEIGLHKTQYKPFCTAFCVGLVVWVVLVVVLMALVMVWVILGVVLEQVEAVASHCWYRC